MRCREPFGQFSHGGKHIGYLFQLLCCAPDGLHCAPGSLALQRVVGRIECRFYFFCVLESGTFLFQFLQQAFAQRCFLQFAKLKTQVFLVFLALCNLLFQRGKGSRQFLVLGKVGSILLHEFPAVGYYVYRVQLEVFLSEQQVLVL